METVVHYTVTELTILGGILVTLIAAVAGAIVNIINAMKNVTIAKDVEAIKGHVNSEKTAAEGREALLRRETELLMRQLHDQAATADLLAQAAAQRGRSNGAPKGGEPKVLEKIEENTAKTADNTGKTQEQVDEALNAVKPGKAE